MMTLIERQTAKLKTHRTSRLLKACEKIQYFSKAMSPFFKITDIFVSSHPDWAAIVWGAIRLVFQLSMNFAGFFERLADMFDELRRELPNYELKIEIIRGRIPNSKSDSKENDKLKVWEEINKCLFKSMSYVYIDILQFCHDAYRLFSKKRRGIPYKVTVIWDIFWKPFDEKFSETLDRLKLHRKTFEDAVEHVYSAQLIQQFNAMDKEREYNSWQREIIVQQRCDAEKRAIEDKMQRLQCWIAASNWTNSFQAAKRKRLGDTGLWVLQENEFKGWEEYKLSHESLGESLLVITAKPGYGKTILSTRIIEHLQQRVLCDTEPLDQASHTPCVAFFFFDQQKADSDSHITALQAVAAQLLYTQRGNKTFIDIASLIMRDESKGENYASEQALMSMIQLYLRHLDGSYLVFDGLDECSEWEKFLELLLESIEGTNCKVVLISRPHLGIAKVIGRRHFRMRLAELANLGEIDAVLRPGITSLVMSGGLGPRFDQQNLEALISSLAKRADSIVLWADLIVKYLDSPFITATERTAIIDAEESFQGLDYLYSKIVQGILRRAPKNQERKVRKILEWLVATQQPWTANMLRTALAVQPNRRCVPGDLIDNFDESLVQLCGPLVEIRQDRCVRFIHISVSEYLSNLENDSRSSLSVKTSVAHCSMATLCLEYLMNEVNHEPLGGDASTRPDQQSVVSQYCLLPYVVSFWPLHASKSIQETLELELTEKPFTLPIFKEFFRLLSKLTTDKMLVTMWIETCYTFTTVPTLLEIPENVLEAAEVVSSHYRKQLTMLGEVLKRFSKNLGDLIRDWSTLLIKEPNEIWLPSTNVFSDSEFWIGTNVANVEYFFSLEDRRSKAIVSQVSADETEVGVIRVWPSNGQNIADNLSQAHPHQPNWTAAYQIWSLETMSLRSTLRFEIPSSNILTSTQAASEGSNDQTQNFRFPVALSSSLRSIIIMGIVIQVPKATSCQNDFLQQTLHDPRCPYGPDDATMIGNQHLHKPRYPLLPQFDSPIYLSDLAGTNTHNWLRYHFSPCENYIFLIATSGVRFNGIAAHAMLFHPTKPVVVFCLMAITVMWRFTLKDDIIEIYKYPLDHMVFSDCGNFLHGVQIGHPGQGEPVFLNLSSQLSPVPSTVTNPENLDRCRRNPVNSVLSDSAGHVLNLGSETRASINNMSISTAPQFTNSPGQHQVSALAHDNDRGSVMLQTIRADGKMTEKTITRLPATLDKSYATLVPPTSHKNLRIVLNKALQDTYDVNTATEFRLPAVLDRAKSSIPVAVYTLKKLLGPSQRRQKRPFDNELIRSGKYIESRDIKKCK
ncbi:hypothetical protein ACMFMF_011762 [Clarireedia jacksonii]